MNRRACEVGLASAKDEIVKKQLERSVLIHASPHSLVAYDIFKFKVLTVYYACRYHDFVNTESKQHQDLNFRFYYGQQPMMGTPFNDETLPEILDKW